MDGASHQLLAGLAAPVFSLVSCLLYLVDIVRGRTRPSRVSWWVMALVNAALAASYYASGARETVWLPAFYAASFAMIGAFSLRWGYGSWTRIDGFCLAGAVAGLLVWWVTRSAPSALALLIAVESVGFVPTVIKAWRAPGSEDLGAWFVANVASALNVAAVTAWSWEIAAYPLIEAASNGLFLGLLIVRLRAGASGRAARGAAGRACAR